MNAMLDVNKLPLEGKGGLIEVLRGITDPRKRRGIRHPFESVLALAVMAALGGMRGYDAIAEWAKDVPKEVLKRLRCWCHQAPSEPTFRRVLNSVDAAEVDNRVYEWLRRQGALKPRAVALDGKTLRGTIEVGQTQGLHLLAAYLPQEGLVLMQVEHLLGQR